MFSNLASFLFGAVIAFAATSYASTLATEYNQLSSAEQVFTRVWCESDAYAKDLQDKIDCYIVNHI